MVFLGMNVKFCNDCIIRDLCLGPALTGSDAIQAEVSSQSVPSGSYTRVRLSVKVPQT